MAGKPAGRSIVRAALVAVTLLVLVLAAAVPLLLAQEPLSKPKIPKEARETANPIPAAAPSVEHGGRLFQSQCAMCHGTDGKGKGDLAETLSMLVPDLSSSAFQAAYTDGELFWVITNGHKRMPADGERFAADLRWHMVNYIRTLKPASD